MAGDAAYRWDVLLVVTSDRYGSELFGTVRRLIDAALGSGHSIQVWACGYSNMLTERSSGPGDPGNGAATCGTGEPSAGSCAVDQPSTAELIGSLVTEYPDRFSWVACRTCSEDQGAGEHIPGVLAEPSFANFREFVDGAAKTIYIGGA